VAERGGGVLFFEATLGLDKREAHSWCSSISGKRHVGEGWHDNTFMIESVPFCCNQSLFFLREKKKTWERMKMELFSPKMVLQTH
jgi:hypothetical protein